MPRSFCKGTSARVFGIFEGSDHRPSFSDEFKDRGVLAPIDWACSKLQAPNWRSGPEMGL
jgi:hypothetical protein